MRRKSRVREWPDGVEIRVLTSGDFDSSLVSSLKNLEFVSSSETPSNLKSIFLQRGHQTVTMIAVHGAVIIGHVAGVAHFSFSGENRAVVCDFAIDPKYRGFGLGQKMFSELERELRERHQVKFLNGPVQPDRLGFYEQVGGKIEIGTFYMTKVVSGR